MGYAFETELLSVLGSYSFSHSTDGVFLYSPRNPFPVASGNMAKSSAFFFQMRMSTPRMPIDISRKLRMSSNFYFLINKPLNHFQGGHSWVELARTVISRTISADSTDIDILAYAYCILMEKGQSNEIMTEALKILQLWLQGLSIS